MFSSRVLVSPTIRACQQPACLWQRLRKFTCSAVLGIEDHFIEKEFEKAREDLDIDALDNPNSLLQKLERDQKRRIKATRRARSARLFKTDNEPRTLTWDTMDQIRYLKQEHGDEWSVKRLAHSFEVTEAAIVKVLKSKFVPAESKRWKQDVRAKTNAGLLPEEKAQPHDAGLERAFTKSKREARQQMKMPDQRTRTQTGEPSVRQTEPNPLAVKEHHRMEVEGWSDHLRKPRQVSSNHPPQKPPSKSNPRKNQDMAYQASEPPHLSQGRRTEEPREARFPEEEEPLNLDMEDLESYDDGSAPPQLIRRGNDFFDENGEFLFRV